MSYPQPPYPQQPQWGPPGPAFPKPPSKGTTITAAILALISGLLSSVFQVTSLVRLGEFLTTALGEPGFLVPFGLGVLATILQLLGAIMLFARVGAGRFLVLAAPVIALGLIAWNAVGYGFLGLTPATLLLLVLDISAAVLAIVPPTGRWIAAKKQPPPGFQQPGPPPPGYQQPGPPPPGYQQPGPPPPGYQQPGNPHPGYGPPQW
ncbi:hypothetical protein Lesp02_77230 [Lentzea sp. NBRC 105346]|uniref:hypothetical protein n=1 Tax=Lentzea sp. NBRC 105346 TaxID=3032205 RepID=UPI0024A065E7|nr:hypothetical protein [Lentzea sp. NBRC 105346]GLZ35536.1 hypothetical protein Lesp02_77230 [Lentzea sp. NBRC 105346]